jgi:hypothetical protein
MTGYLIPPTPASAPEGANCHYCRTVFPVDDIQELHVTRHYIKVACPECFAKNACPKCKKNESEGFGALCSSCWDAENNQ